MLGTMNNMVSNKNSIIVYVNYAPYENAGKILDYLFEKYDRVISFTFNFHRLNRKNDLSRLRVYQGKKVISEHRLYFIPTPPSLTFILLPIRSIIIFLQLILHLYLLKKKYKEIHTYFTVNAFTAWTGNIAKRLGLVQRTVFWVWDYYPPFNKSLIVTFMRWLYWQLDKPASLQSDKTVFLNKRLQDARKKMGTISKNVHYDTVEIGTDPLKRIRKKSTDKLSFVFFGVIKRSQGLGLFFDAFDAEEISKTVELHVIGGGPDLEYFKNRAKISHIKVKFYGYIADDNKVNMIIDLSLIGLATYAPDESNVTHYTDPSKIKKYISRGLPVITTDVFEFSNEIVRHKAGVIIPYKKKYVIPSIQLILENYHEYSQNALTLAHKYLYSRLYKRLFL